MYIVQFNCDVRLNHQSSISEHITTDSKSFDNAEEAVDFLNECTNPITKIDEIVNLNNLDKNSKVEYNKYQERVTKRNKLA